MQSRRENRSALPFLFGACLIAFFAGCFASSDPNAVPHGTGGAGGGTSDESAGVVETGATAGSGDEPTGDAGAAPMRNGKCNPVQGEPLLQRSSILSNTVQPTELEISVAEVFNKFKVQCGACHYEQGLGGFQVKAKDYIATMQNPEILTRIQTDDRTLAMPSLPPVPYSQLPADSSLRELVKLLQEWNAAGNPPDVFYEKLPVDQAASPFALSTDLGLAFTNIGTCVPAADFAFASDRATMVALDADFAARKPATDDNADALAKIGLPENLSDTDFTSFDSEVLARRGLIAFAPAYPLWSDDAGKLRYVRVPVGTSIKFNAKTQQFDIPENTRFYKTFMKQVTDVNGKQRFRKLETRLIVARHDLTSPQDPNYKPQSLFGSYEWDETETHATLLTDTLRDGDPFTDHLFEYVVDEPKAAAIRATKPDNLTYALEFQKVASHWAVPGSQRCIHCHEGSLNDNFVIGFTPLQMKRRKLGEGGVYEAPSPDELGQLQRFIDLGVVTGIKSADDILNLEDSQGDRKPRNDEELRAQGYMLANCAHCHNQNGFPSVAAKELKDVLNFYPGKRESETVIGGVFQFPLEKFSPRITRFDQLGIAYITPSLRDVQPPDAKNYTSKYSQAIDPNSPVGDVYVNAPWRSLIYRNVKTAFTYAEAGTLYPHMPFDTGGHDCRASQWLGEWMVSIPAVRKNPDVSENCTADCPDPQPQPYTEVFPGNDGYNDAVAAAKARLKLFKNDPEYATCPDNTDIVDPDVLGGYRPAPIDKTGDGVPDHSNWVVTDLTERKGLWSPRRDDWKQVLVDHLFPPPASGDSTGAAKLAAQEAIVGQLSDLHLSDVASFANAKFPLALWKNKAGCKFDGVSKVKDFTGDQRPAWFDRANPDPDAPVFAVRPGQAVFDMICINCHGPNADSLGRQADTLQNLTGGNARVANFRFGLFNPGSFDDPYDSPDLGLQTNRQRVFGSVASADTTIDDWGARYLAWMALGGTNVIIPDAILQQVANTGVGGVNRNPGLQGQGSANMLQVAQYACQAALAQGLPIGVGPGADGLLRDKGNSLIAVNGDMELWRRLCSLGNTIMVRAVNPTLNGDGNIFNVYAATPCDTQGQPANCYSGPVGNQSGQIVPSLDANNTFPWCLDPTIGTPYNAQQIQDYAANHLINGQPLPVCPTDWITHKPATEDHDAQVLNWTNRGAINAGFSVFEFLDAFIKGDIQHVGYDQCEMLPAVQ